MTKELYDKIFEQRHIATSCNLKRESFDIMLESHPEGFKKVMDLWTEENKELRWGAAEWTQGQYYHNLADAGIITLQQLYRLNGQMDTTISEE